jgi:hypothetical protein
MASPTQVLERRYRLLLRAYPAAYRAERGEEILTTLLESVPRGRRAPSLADAVDVLGNGMRRRWGLHAAAGLDAGLALAAPVALALAAGIAGFAWWRVEPIGDIHMGQSALFGTFRTLGPFAFALWLVAALGWVVPRPDARRALIAIAVVATLALPVVSALTTVDRPPLWVIMSLVAFGLLALVGAGSSRATLDARLTVPIGALGIAVGAATLSTVAAPNQYYQPTIARVGLVVTATVAILAVVALVRRLRGQRSAAWLWAAALLGLPAGWLGPFESGGDAVPHFGRLAQVVLATCLAAATVAWLARRAFAGPRALSIAGAAALGASGGLGAFDTVLWASAGTDGASVGWTVLVPIAAVALAGAIAVSVGGNPGRRGVAVALAGTAATLAASAVVAVYDNGWAVTGWDDVGRTASLVATIALIPLSACAHAAARVLVERPGDPRTMIGAAVVLLIGLGWIGYAALPYLRSWGPMLFTLALCWVAATLPAGRTA